MRYRVFKFGDILGKNYRVFITNRMEGSLHSLAKNWLIYLPTRKKFDASRLSTKKIYLYHYVAISMLQLDENFILNCVHSCRTIFILIEYSWYLQVMLTLILIDNQYVENVAFSFKKSSNCQNHSSSDSHLPTT